MNDLVIIAPTRMQPSDYLRLIASILAGLIWVAWRKKTRPPVLKAHSAVVSAPVNIQRPIMTPSDISELEKKYLENPQKNHADVLISLMGGIPNSEAKESYPEPASLLLSRIIAQCSVTELLHLDERMRQSCRLNHQGGWARISPEEVESYRTLGDRAVTLWGLSSFHANGYIRERAVRCLGKSSSAEVIPFLLLRLNDWVTPVHNAALSALQERVAKGEVGEFIPWLELVDRLRLARRTDLSGFQHVILSALLKEANRETLWKVLNHPQSIIRRVAFRMALSVVPPDMDILVRGVNDTDPSIRFWTIQVIRDSRLPANKAIIERLLHDHSSKVRSEALTIALTAFPDGATSLAETALFDRHPFVRMTARRHLGVHVAVAAYREALKSTNPIPAAVSGLGEVGSEADAAMIEPLLQSDTPQIRASAIGALQRLEPDGHTETFFKMISDPSRAVVRAVIVALSRRPRAISAERYADIFRNKADLWILRRLLRLVAAGDKWSSIPILLEASSDTHPEIAEYALGLIAQWNRFYPRSSIVPTNAQKTAYQCALDSNRARIPKRLLNDLTFTAQRL